MKPKTLPLFTATKAERELIQKITNRALRLMDFLPTDKTNLMMDVEACHCNGCPLDLEKLLKADPFDFIHDMAGIRYRLDRSTGKLKDHFLPRCAMPETATNT